jgi:pentatricopeptide repeat protein
LYKPTDSSCSAVQTAAKSRPKLPKLREKILTDLKQDGFEPNALTYECYISALVAHNELEHAVDVLETIENAGITPTMLTYANILQSATSVNEALFAGELLEKMEKVYHPLSPDLYIGVLRLSASEKKVSRANVLDDCASRILFT